VSPACNSLLFSGALVNLVFLVSVIRVPPENFLADLFIAPSVEKIVSFYSTKTTMIQKKETYNEIEIIRAIFFNGKMDRPSMKLLFSC
jgi:hypothetical protein